MCVQGIFHVDSICVSCWAYMLWIRGWKTKATCSRSPKVSSINRASLGFDVRKISSKCVTRVLVRLNRSFYPSTSSTISVRANSSILESSVAEKSYATEILLIHCSAVSRVENAMPCHDTGHDRHDIRILWEGENKINHRTHKRNKQQKRGNKARKQIEREKGKNTKGLHEVLHYVCTEKTNICVRDANATHSKKCVNNNKNKNNTHELGIMTINITGDHSI